METIHIIIIDDHVLIKNALRTLLELNKKFTVNICTDESEIFNLIRQQPKLIIIIDINMKPVNGFDMTENILKRYPKQKIIAFSIHNDLQYKLKFQTIGGLAYITKDQPSREIVSTILKVSNNQPCWIN